MVTSWAGAWAGEAAEGAAAGGASWTGWGGAGSSPLSPGRGAGWVPVSHGDTIKSILADALGMHLDLFQRIGVDPASVSIIRYTEARPYVLASNTHEVIETINQFQPLNDPPMKSDIGLSNIYICLVFIYNIPLFS